MKSLPDTGTSYDDWLSAEEVEVEEAEEEITGEEVEMFEVRDDEGKVERPEGDSKDERYRIALALLKIEFGDVVKEG
jgi:flavin-binding protein dodecin